MTVQISNGEIGSSVRSKLNALLGTARTILTANATYYVATNGNDTTGDGSVGAPWLTPQKAMSWINASLDFNGFTVTVQLADGTYTMSAQLAIGGWIGPGSLIVQGNMSDKTLVTLTRASGTVAAFRGFCHGAILRNVSVVGSNSMFSAAVEHFGKGDAHVNDCNVGGGYYAFFCDEDGATLFLGGDTGITHDGQQGAIFGAQQGGVVFAYTNVTNLKGSACNYFGALYGDSNARLEFQGSTTGTFTGQKFQLYGQACARARANDFANIPGDTAGACNENGTFAGNYTNYVSWDSQITPTTGSGTVTLDLSTSRNFVHTTSNDVILAFTKWPVTGFKHEFWLEVVNGGAHTITWPTINWLKSDGSTSTTFSDQGVALQSSGVNFIRLWSRDSGTTIYGQVVHG